MMTDREPLFCFPFRLRSQVVSQMEHYLAQHSFDDARQFVRPSESQNNPVVAATVRARVLADVYGPEYPAAVQDITRVSASIAAGDEHVWFWGDIPEIARLRNQMQCGEVVAEHSKLGTFTLLSAEQMFGLGHAETCRTGSMAKNVRGAQAFAQRSFDFLNDLSPGSLANRYHSVVSLARNCGPSSRAADGIAIHTIQKRTIQSRFWGFAPWYVMPGDALEILELRELNRDSEDVVVAIKQSLPWQFAHDDESEYANALVRMNFGFDSPIVCNKSFQKAQPLHFRPIVSSSTKHRNTAFGALVAEQDSTFVRLKEGLSKLACSNVACQTVVLDLTDPRSIPLQIKLRNLGFVLHAIIPPKHTWLGKSEKDRTPVHITPKGIWGLPRRDLALVPPFYSNAQPQTHEESAVLAHLNERIITSV